MVLLSSSQGIMDMNCWGNSCSVQPLSGANCRNRQYPVASHDLSGFNDKGKEKLGSHTLALNCFILEVTLATFTHNSLARVNSTALTKFKAVGNTRSLIVNK